MNEENKIYKDSQNHIPDDNKKSNLSLGLRIYNLMDDISKGVVKMPTIDIYLSAKHSDNALRFNKRLKNLGYSVYYNPFAFPENLMTYYALQNAKVFILYITDISSIDDEKVKYEWETHYKKIKDGFISFTTFIVCYYGVDETKFPPEFTLFKKINLMNKKRALFELNEYIKEVLSEQLKKVDIKEINKDKLKQKLLSKNQEEYILFGMYPQTVKDDNVEIMETNDGIYNLGSDGNRYYSFIATPHYDGIYFSNNQLIVSGEKYFFKVEPVKWKILKKEEDALLLITKDVIDAHMYDSVTWNYHTSNIKKYLDTEVYEMMFNEMERDLIKIENDIGRIFLLDRKFYTTSQYPTYKDTRDTDQAREKKPTDFAKAKGAFVSSSINYSGNTYYWLRTSYKDYCTFYVDWDGGISYGNDTIDSNTGVAIALWLKIKG